MKRFEFLILLCCGLVCFISAAKAEGLPANPWQKPQKLNTAIQKEGSELAEHASAVAEDIWSKVRDTKEFRQWSMPKTEEKQNSDAGNKQETERRNMLILLSNLNKVGYALPENYQGIVNKIPLNRGFVAKTSQTNKASGKASSGFSYDREVKQWQRKLNQAKRNSLNILDNSYRRVLSTIKSSTGVDVNRAINDTIRDTARAFK